jgi:hypothetical protein
MSDRVSRLDTRRLPSVRAGRPLLLTLAGVPVLAAAVVALAIAGAQGLLRSAAGALDVDLPKWIHNLADLLQILTAVIAFLAWESARRGRR